MGTEEDAEFVGSRKVVEKLRVGYTFRALMTAEVDRFIEAEYNTAVHRLESFILAEKLAEDEYTDHVTTAVPSSTWQYFKATHAESWWFGWFVNRHPVDYHVTYHDLITKVKRYATYPEADIALPGLGRPVIWEQVDTVTRSSDGT